MIWIIGTATAMPPLTFVQPNGVEYAQVLTNTEFQTWVSSLPEATVPIGSSNDTKAFWINVYNGLTIQTVAENMPISSIKDIDNGTVWTSRTFVVAGKEVTLDSIEKEFLVAFKDPRIHAALNCASKGCPALFEQPFTGDNLDAQLDLVSKRWIETGGFKYTDGWFGNTVSLSTIFDWYKQDFPCDASKPVPSAVGKEYCGILQFVAQHAPEYQKVIESTSYELTFQAYDWSVNSIQ